MQKKKTPKKLDFWKEKFQQAFYFVEKKKKMINFAYFIDTKWESLFDYIVLYIECLAKILTNFEIFKN